MAGHWVTIDGRHVLIEEDGGHSGAHNPATHTGNKTTDAALSGKDVTAERLAEVKQATNFGGANIREFTAKGSSAPLTKTEESVLAKFKSQPANLGFTSNALVYADAVRALPKSERKALLSLLERRKLTVTRLQNPTREILG